MKTFGSRWRERYETLRSGYARSLESDPWRGWVNEREPERRVSVELAQGIQVLLSGDEVTARRFFERGMDICIRAGNEKPCLPPDAGTDPAAAPAYPLNRAELARYRAHLRGLLGEHHAPELGAHDFREAAADFKAWCEDYNAGTWGEVGQGYTLDGVRLSLLAGEVEFAAKALKTRRKFRHHAEEHALLADLTMGDRSPEIRLRLEALLDRIRDPDAKSDAFRNGDLVPIELALLLDRFFLNPKEPLQWRRAVSRVAQ